MVLILKSEDDALSTHIFVMDFVFIATENVFDKIMDSLKKKSII